MKRLLIYSLIFLVSVQCQSLSKRKRNSHKSSGSVTENTPVDITEDLQDISEEFAESDYCEGNTTKICEIAEDLSKEENTPVLEEVITGVIEEPVLVDETVEIVEENLPPNSPMKESNNGGAIALMVIGSISVGGGGFLAARSFVKDVWPVRKEILETVRQRVNKVLGTKISPLTSRSTSELFHDMLDEDGSFKSQSEFVDDLSRATNLNETQKTQGLVMYYEMSNLSSSSSSSQYSSVDLQEDLPRVASKETWSQLDFQEYKPSFSDNLKARASQLFHKVKTSPGKIGLAIGILGAVGVGVGASQLHLDGSSQEKDLQKYLDELNRIVNRIRSASEKG